MFEKDVILAPYTNFKIGGPAKYFFIAQNEQNLARAINKAREEGLPIFILGGATNILIPDEGFDGLVIKPEFLQIELLKDFTIKVGSSVLVKDLLEFCLSYGLSGLEWAGGLPGTVGGAIYGNAGAFGGETKDNLEEVVSLNLDQSVPSKETRNNDQCHFNYRMSIFKKRAFEKLNASAPSYAPPRDVIIEATFRLEKGDKNNSKKLIQEKRNYRKNRQPIEYPNIGSIHKNVDMSSVPKAVAEKYADSVKVDPFPVMPAALLISEAGLKGKTIGDAQVSEKHPNFIINLGSAKASDVKKLAKFVQKTVKEKFDITLEREVIFL